MKAAVCLLLRNEFGQILAVSRKHDTNDFGLPGGKVDPGETEEEAAIRELREETGLELTTINKIFVHDCAREYLTSCWTGDYSGELHTSEVGIIKWVEPIVLLQGSFGEYNQKLFDALDIQV